MNQQNPVPPTQVYSTCNQGRMALIFFTIMFLLVGFVFTSVGVWAKPFWGPEDDPRCSFCKEERIAMEQRLKNCRIAGPIFLAIGVFLWMTTIIVDVGQVVTIPIKLCNVLPRL